MTKTFDEAWAESLKDLEALDNEDTHCPTCIDIRTDALAMAIETAKEIALGDGEIKDCIAFFALGFEQYLKTGLFPLEWEIEYPDDELFKDAEIV